MPEKPIGLKEAIQYFDGYDSNHRASIEKRKESLRASINKNIKNGFLEHGFKDAGFIWKETIGLSPKRLNEIVINELAEEYLSLHLILDSYMSEEKNSRGFLEKHECLRIRPVADKIPQIKKELQEEKIRDAKKREEEAALAIEEEKRKQIEQKRREEEENKARQERVNKNTPDEITKALFNLEAAKNKMSIVWKPNEVLSGYLFFGEVESDINPIYTKRPSIRITSLDLVEFSKIIKEFKYKVSMFSWIYALLFLNSYFKSIQRGACLTLQVLLLKDPHKILSLPDKVKTKIERIVEEEIEEIEKPKKPASGVKEVWH